MPFVGLCCEQVFVPQEGRQPTRETPSCTRKTNVSRANAPSQNVIECISTQGRAALQREVSASAWGIDQI